jgi:hypothetical protein
MIAADFFPYGLRPGKLLIDAIISLSRRESDIHLSRLINLTHGQSSQS